MRQLKDLGLIIAYELHGFRFYIVTAAALLSAHGSVIAMSHCFAHRKTLLQNIAGVQMITHSASVPAYSAVRKMLLRTAAYSEG